MPGFSYPEVGATRDGGAELPAGYAHLRHRTRVGSGPAAFAAAGEAVLTWRMHRAAGVRVTGSARAEAGARVLVRLGPGPLALTAPCEVVWTVAEQRRAGFAYGTLPGHPECGEESFAVEQDDDGEVWFAVVAFSRPARWFTRAAGPLVPVFQRLYVRRCGSVLRGIVRADTGAGDGAGTGAGLRP